MGDRPGDPWPDWRNLARAKDPDVVVDSMVELASYANPAMLANLGFPVSMYDGDPALAAAQLADAFASRKIAFAVDPFRPLGGAAQTIRTASELLQGQGTCADFAVAIAAGCVAGGVDVALALIRPAVPVDELDTGETADHVVVIVPSSDVDLLFEKDVSQSPGPDLITRLDRRQLHLLDVTPLPGVAAQGAVALTASTMRTLEMLQQPSSIVHIVWVQKALASHGRSFHDLPPRPRALGITSLLPEPMPRFRSFPSRRTAEEKLGVARGTIVIAGRTGAGKSSLALGQALAVDGGRGWWLNASDRRTLQTSLSVAEAQCRGQVLENTQGENVQSFAAQALARLRASDAPWVVVLDNADCEPDDLVDLLPQPKGRDLLIITTTNEKWLSHPRAAAWAKPICIEALSEEDLDSDESARELAADLRLPGLLKIVAQLPTGIRGERLGSVADLVGNALPNPSRSGDPRLDDLSLSLLVVSALLPPEDIRLDLLATTHELAPELVENHLVRLSEAGLLEPARRVGDVRQRWQRTYWMHRLVRKAVLDVFVPADNPPIWVGSLLSRLIMSEARALPEIVRSSADLTLLADLMGRLCAHEQAAPSLRPAIVELLSRLETLGMTAVAGDLATRSLNHFGIATQEERVEHALVVLAIARRANHDAKTDLKKVDVALELCRSELDSLSRDSASAVGLTRGRLKAMEGIMLKKKGDVTSRVDADAGLHLLQESIRRLTDSYEDRASALGWDTEARRWLPDRSRRDDPDRHVDRAWYNLGGAHLVLAKHFLGPETAPARAAATQNLSRAMDAYSGSLGLRPDNDFYTAASAWGVALILYMAAINDIELDLSGASLTEDLEQVRGGWDRSAALLSAERNVTRAHEIWTQITGPMSSHSQKTRALLFKVGLAWRMSGRQAGDVEKQVEKLREMLRADLGLGPLESDEPPLVASALTGLKARLGMSALSLARLLKRAAGRF